MEINNWRCERCFTQEKQLNIHHSFYRRGSLLWQYKNEELECLCNKCHKEAHKIDEKLRHAIALLDIENKHRILGYIEALHHNGKLEPDSFDYFVGLSDYITSILEGKKQRKKRTNLLIDDILENKETTSSDVVKRMASRNFL